MAKLAELESIKTNLQPTLVILETSVETGTENDKIRQSLPPSSPSLSVPKRQEDLLISAESSGFYGLALLEHISTEISNSNFSKLIVPVAMVLFVHPSHPSSFRGGSVHSHRPSPGALRRISGSIPLAQEENDDNHAFIDPRKMLPCLQAGAVDVLTSPLQRNRINGLTAHAYRAYKDYCQDSTAFLSTNSLRKRSWVGYEDKKPYAYLREDMYVILQAQRWSFDFDAGLVIWLTLFGRVSGLMTGICNPNNVSHAFDIRWVFRRSIDDRSNADGSCPYRTLPVLEARRESEFVKAIGSWGFSAHDYSEDELVHVAFLILQHALSMPELETWRLSAGELLLMLRNANEVQEPEY